ncbi:hypothetical protein A2U01_0069539, partial [Trifolium medium]|nr:hypothetical protein [Trifolium medium]
PSPSPHLPPMSAADDECVLPSVHANHRACMLCFKTRVLFLGFTMQHRCAVLCVAVNE